MSNASDALEMEVIKENDGCKVFDELKDEESPTNLFRRSTGSKRRKKKPTRTTSSSSLHSLVSILKPPHTDQRSAPNVSFGNENNGINNAESKTSLNATFNPSIGESSSQFHYMMEGEGSSRIAGGSFSTQTSTIGFRASFFSVLEKLGVWRSQDLYKTSQNANEAKCPPERKTARSSITSLYFRSLYDGKYSCNAIEISITTCCKAPCRSSL